jgi:excinuclease ABC subunit A
LGFQTVCDPEKLITHPHRPLPDGAMDGTGTGKFYGDPYGQFMATLLFAGKKHGMDFSLPWDELTGDAREFALFGAGDEVFEVSWQYKRDNRTGEHRFTGPWKGVAALVNEEYVRKHADHRGERMLPLMKQMPCEACHGTRLRPEALNYTILGKNIAEMSSLPVSQASGFFSKLAETAGSGMQGQEVITPLAAEILRKLGFLSALGLSYLSIDRPANTLSGGESRRIRLSGQLGSGLTGLTYVLDEPTIGLHPRDTAKLMEMIRSLQQAGNTVIIVEHDREVIQAADHVIEIGPGAGKNGGKVIAAGTPEELMNHPEPVTGPYPGDGLLIPGLSIKNAFANNLKGFDLEIPSGCMVAITGVSGSGKSTLMFDVILKSWENKKPAGCSFIGGFERFTRVVSVHQRTGFTSSLATPATFTGVFDRIREIFAGLPVAKASGFGKSAFSYLDKTGRCPVCEGTGQTRVSMDFLPEVKLVCETCHGTRYRKEVLSCLYHGISIAGILALTLEEAVVFFNDQPVLQKQLQVLEKVGLGYLQLGQPLDTLSGGESQRLVLATELLKPGKGPALYLFEEPSTGLHFRDTGYLVKLFLELAGHGHTLLIIEHDPLIIARAGHVIELGPEGGDLGGFLVASG